MAKSKLFASSKNPGRKVNAYNSLQKQAKKARYTKSRTIEGKYFFKEKFESKTKYHGRGGHDIYSAIMDAIPEGERDEWRNIDSEETFYFGEPMITDDIPFEIAKSVRDRITEEELEKLAASVENLTDEEFDELMQNKIDELDDLMPF